jgi:hypothetical protein
MSPTGPYRASDVRSTPSAAPRRGPPAGVPRKGLHEVVSMKWVRVVRKAQPFPLDARFFSLDLYACDPIAFVHVAPVVKLIVLPYMVMCTSGS